VPRALGPLRQASTFRVVCDRKKTYAVPTTALTLLSQAILHLCTQYLMFSQASSQYRTCIVAITNTSTERRITSSNTDTSSAIIYPHAPPHAFIG